MVRARWLTPAALAATGACGAALGLASPSARPLALGLIAAWTGVVAWRIGRVGVATALPSAALAPLVGGWGALIGWSCAALAAAAAPWRWRVDGERVRAVRNELRDAEHERALLHRHIQRYPVLLEACLELSSARDIDQLATALVARVRALVPHLAWVRVHLGPGDAPPCVASADASGTRCDRPPGDEERYVACESRTLTRREGGLVRVLIPLRGDRRRVADRDALRGVLAVALSAGESGARLELELLSALARLGGLGLGAVDLLAQARGLALHDELTGLFGQHEFLRRLDELAASCRRKREPLAVVMIDLDHLKRFNDAHGHDVGDQALRTVADALRRALPNAVVCRYGGEEFAAALPGCDARAAAAGAEAARSAIARARLDPRRPELRVTGSLGWALIAPDEGARAVLARADAACYRAKKAGRDRVEADPPDAARGAAP